MVVYHRSLVGIDPAHKVFLYKMNIKISMFCSHTWWHGKLHRSTTIGLFFVQSWEGRISRKSYCFSNWKGFEMLAWSWKWSRESQPPARTFEVINSWRVPWDFIETFSRAQIIYYMKNIFAKFRKLTILWKYCFFPRLLYFTSFYPKSLLYQVL